MKTIALLMTFFYFAVCTSLSQEALLQSGPMVGHAAFREVRLWVQTTAPSTVWIEYRSNDKSNHWFKTDSISTQKSKNCIAHLLADSVTPGQRYEYKTYINGKYVPLPYRCTFVTPSLWQWRSDPPDFSIALGSCTYINEEQYDRPGRAYGGLAKIFRSIIDKEPNIMLWLGDNIYLREADWTSKTGIFHRYSHTRKTPEMQPLLAGVSNYALWDDHDFGPNDSDRGYTLKHTTFDAFLLHWANPESPLAEDHSSCTAFEWGDVQFFLLDNRSFRSPNNRKTGEKSIFGKKQIEWLVDNLSSSKATFKIIAAGGQFLNSAAVYENYSTAPEERNFLLSLIEQEKIEGVFFLSGDRHHTELTKIERKSQYPLYDLTCSPLTAGVSTVGKSENNSGRVDGTFVQEHNFATLTFFGAKKSRSMKISVFSAEGVLLWEKIIAAKELQ